MSPGVFVVLIGLTVVAIYAVATQVDWPRPAWSAPSGRPERRSAPPGPRDIDRAVTDLLASEIVRLPSGELDLPSTVNIFLPAAWWNRLGPHHRVSLERRLHHKLVAFGASPQVQVRVFPRTEINRPRLQLPRYDDEDDRTPADVVREAPRPAPRPTVELRDGDQVVALLPPGTALRLGKLQDNDVVLPGTYASKYHAWLRSPGPSMVSVEDLSSTNGTFVDGERVRRARRLTCDAVLRFGDVELRLCFPEDPSDPLGSAHPSGRFDPSGPPTMPA